MIVATRTDWTGVATRLAEELGAFAERHDAEGSFVAEGYAGLARERLFGLLVPGELGGGGASVEETCQVIRALARRCPSTALAFSMHTHLVAAAVWRWRNGKPAEALLRRVAAEQLVLVSTGATDWVDSNGEMTRVPGGYRVSARKVFASGSPGAALLVTSARFGSSVLHFSVPFSAAGVRVLEDWDTLGMRGTGSNTVLFEDVFVPEEAVTLERPQGEWHVAWTVAATLALPLLMSAYVGIAEEARALALADAREKLDDSTVPLLVGELENACAATGMAWRDMIANAAEFEFPPTVESANRALIGKTLLAQNALATVEKAMEISGGRGFFRRHALQRLLRDVHAAPYHPLPEKKQLRFSGRLALGLAPVEGR